MGFWHDVFHGRDKPDNHNHNHDRPEHVDSSLHTGGGSTGGYHAPKNHLVDTHLHVSTPETDKYNRHEHEEHNHDRQEHVDSSLHLSSLFGGDGRLSIPGGASSSDRVHLRNLEQSMAEQKSLIQRFGLENVNPSSTSGSAQQLDTSSQRQLATLRLLAQGIVSGWNDKLNAKNSETQALDQRFGVTPQSGSLHLQSLDTGSMAGFQASLDALNRENEQATGRAQGIVSDKNREISTITDRINEGNTEGGSYGELVDSHLSLEFDKPVETRQFGVGDYTGSEFTQHMAQLEQKYGERQQQLRQAHSDARQTIAQGEYATQRQQEVLRGKVDPKDMTDKELSTFIHSRGFLDDGRTLSPENSNEEGRELGRYLKENFKEEYDTMRKNAWDQYTHPTSKHSLSLWDSTLVSLGLKPEDKSYAHHMLKPVTGVGFMQGAKNLYTDVENWVTHPFDTYYENNNNPLDNGEIKDHFNHLLNGPGVGGVNGNFMNTDPSNLDKSLDYIHIGAEVAVDALGITAGATLFASGAIVGGGLGTLYSILGGLGVVSGVQNIVSQGQQLIGTSHYNPDGTISYNERPSGALGTLGRREHDRIEHQANNQGIQYVDNIPVKKKTKVILGTKKTDDYRNLLLNKYGFGLIQTDDKELDKFQGYLQA